MSVTYRKTVLRIAGFIASILLIAFSILLLRKMEFLAGSILLVISVILFLLSVKVIDQHPLTDDEVTYLKPYVFPALLLIEALALTGLLVVNLTTHSRTPPLNRWASAEWLISILCLAAGILWMVRWKPARLRSVWEWIRANQLELGLASLIVVFSLVIRTLDLTAHPYPWTGDEASIGMEARRILSGDNTDWFSTGWSGQPNVSFFPTAINMLIYGENIFAIKVTSALTGTLAVLAVYLLAREWFGWKTALVASGFMAAYPFHVQYSRIGVNNIFDSLMAPLVIWLIFRAARTKSHASYLLAGIASGLTFYTYVGSRLVLAMAIGTFVYLIIQRKGFIKGNLGQLATYLAALLVTLAPIVTFFSSFPQLFMTRLGQEGIFLNGWLPRQVDLTGQSVWQVLGNQFLKTTLVFVSQNASGGLLNFDRPYLTVLGAIFFTIGLAVAFRHLFDERYFILQAWFGSVLFLGGFLTLNPPASTRLVMTIPATALFIAIGVWQVSRVLLHLRIKPEWVYSLNLALLIILALQNLFFYFNTYRDKNYFEDANGELAMEAGMQLQQLGRNYDYYLFGTPRVFTGFPTTEFLVPGIPKYDLVEGSIPQLLLNRGRGALIVAIPENENLLQQVARLFPGGRWEAVLHKDREEALYFAYILTPEQIYSR